MNIVTDNLDPIIDAPDGIKRLRELILQLAVQGRLVEQRPEDGTAADLLRQIEAAKRKDAEQRKARGERVRKQKPLPNIGKDEIPFDIPDGWEWVRLGELSTLITKGSSPKWQGVKYVDEGQGILFVTSENVGSMKMLLEKRKYLEERFNEIEPRSILQKNDLLMNIVGASIGRCALYDVDEMANINQAVCLIRCASSGAYVDLSYLLRFMNSNTCISYMFDKQVDVARANLSLGNIAQFLIPLPPLAEQKRIVAKVDELMGWCDSLEALKEKRAALRTAALKSTLHSWVGTDRRAVRKDEVGSAVPAVRDGALGEHALPSIFPLITTPADIKQLRDAILQLAVQGRLVEQRESDGTAADLLKEIEAAKAAKAADLQRRKARGERIRKTNPLPPIEPDEILFDIPENWEWARMRSVFSDIGQKVPDVPFSYIDVSAINKERGVVTHDDVNVIQPDDAPSRARKLVEKGVVIYSTVRPYLLNIAIIDKDFDPQPIVSTAFSVLKPFAGTSARLLYYYLRSPAFTEYVESKQKGVAYPAISESEFNLGLYPLPPLAEQQRIVEKVDELMAWCDELETLLQTQSDTATRFAAAIAKA